jgi:hypothetical protein
MVPGPDSPRRTGVHLKIFFGDPSEALKAVGEVEAF